MKHHPPQRLKQVTHWKCAPDGIAPACRYSRPGRIATSEKHLRQDAGELIHIQKPAKN